MVPILEAVVIGVLDDASDAGVDDHDVDHGTPIRRGLHGRRDGRARAKRGCRTTGFGRPEDLDGALLLSASQSGRYVIGAVILIHEY